jgi:hypothetical protein
LTDYANLKKRGMIKMKKKIDEKREITPKWVIRFTSKLQGW